MSGLWQRLIDSFRPKASGSEPLADMRPGSAGWNALTGGAGGAPSESEAMGLTAVHACVSLISGAIGALPMVIYDRRPDGDLRANLSHPHWWMLNEEFCPRWTAAAGWSFLAASRMLHGDAFAEILRNPRDGSVTGLVPLLPQRVRVIATPDGRRLVYEIQPDPTLTAPLSEAQRIRVLDQDDVLHVPGFGFNGLRGLSVLRNALRTSGRLALAAQDFSSAFLQNNAQPHFALEMPGNMTPENFNKLQAQLDARRAPGMAGREMILEGGLTIKTLTMPLEDMQLLETRRFQVEEIARAFNVPPFMIGHTSTTTSWGSGVEAMGAGFVRYTLRDHLNAFQNEINRKFYRRPDMVAEFDTAELERGDFKSMMEGLRVGLGRAGEPAFFTLEEVRTRARLPKRMDGTIPATAPAPVPAAMQQQQAGGGQ